MVQLHFEDTRIKGIVKRAREELGSYWPYLVEFYDDILSDTQVTSLATIYNYIVKLKIFLRWLKTRGIKPEDIDERLLKEYIRELRFRLKPATMDSYIKTLKRFLKLIGKENLAASIKYPKKPQPRYELPDPEIIEKIIGNIERLDYQLIIALIYETGARISEILALKGKHVQEAPEGYFRLQLENTKNGEFRTVFVIKYASLLRNYLNIKKPKPEDWLFPSPCRPGKPLHPRNVEKFLKRLGQKHGVKLHPHILRHLRGTLLVKEGMQERVVMKLLGHKTEKMISIYVNLTAKDVEEALLSKYGIEVRKPSKKETIKCPKCGATNPAEARYCWRCGLPLSQISAAEREAKVREVEELLTKIRNLLMQNPELARQLLTS